VNYVLLESIRRGHTQNRDGNAVGTCGTAICQLMCPETQSSPCNVVISFIRTWRKL